MTSLTQVKMFTLFLLVSSCIGYSQVTIDDDDDNLEVDGETDTGDVPPWLIISQRIEAKLITFENTLLLLDATINHTLHLQITKVEEKLKEITSKTNSYSSGEEQFRNLANTVLSLETTIKNDPQHFQIAKVEEQLKEFIAKTNSYSSGEEQIRNLANTVLSLEKTIINGTQHLQIAEVEERLQELITKPCCCSSEEQGVKKTMAFPDIKVGLPTFGAEPKLSSEPQLTSLQNAMRGLLTNLKSNYTFTGRLKEIDEELFRN